MLSTGLSLNQLVYSIFLIYGAAAIPSDEINVIGNYGTVATCTTQGFFIYVCSNSSHLYYASFSVYSFVGVLHNFEKEKYMWVEKYIHAIVPIYPLITAFVILSKQGFNNNGGGICFVKNTPLDCNYPNYDDVPCVRGPLSVSDSSLSFELCKRISSDAVVVVEFIVFSGVCSGIESDVRVA